MYVPDTTRFEAVLRRRLTMAGASHLALISFLTRGVALFAGRSSLSQAQGHLDWKGMRHQHQLVVKRLALETTLAA